MKGFVITGTDTGIGKTTAAAMLTLALDAMYWKPVQSGTEGGTDTETVRRLTGLPPDRFIPERYILTQPLSPHRAAELDGVTIDPLALRRLPGVTRSLIVEGAGGLMVPLTRYDLLIDLFRMWDLPVVLCARTGLGTINHTLLSVEALRRRDIPIHGVLFIGDDNSDTIRTIEKFSGLRVLGRLPVLETLSAEILLHAFNQGLNIEDFM